LGFTLIEVVLVLVVIVVVSGITVPHFAGTFRGTKLRTAARTFNRMARYARSMAIMREQMLTVALNPETMEVFLGAPPSQTTPDDADGELDQDVLKRLGYTDDDESDTAGLEKELHRFLPEGLMVRHFEKDWADEDEQHGEFHLVRYYPNGQCEWFELELEDNRGMGIKLENDPITGKIHSEFTQ
jgi:prepilin-type N-terminal cleavage/methylation domain-containing protein